ncbi:MAG: glycosyltransferase [Alphaproteobacteria bacterium]|nr:glycosyltransferase [Alphaproteobacteria bacterium]MBV9860853.1 glycosyltransferase [Alphaproteobacteria bacterium]
MSNAGHGIAVSLTPLPLEADSRAFRIATTLAEAGFRSIVVEGRASERRFWDASLEVRALAASRPDVKVRHAAMDGLREGRLGRSGEEALYVGFRVREWARRRRARPQIPAAELYYLHSFELHRAVAPLAASCGARLVYDAHDFYRGILPPERQPSFDRRWLRPFLDGLEDRLVAAADAVITVSDGVAALMERTFGRRPAVIRNAHDERLDRPVARDLRASLGLAPTDRLCVVVGNCKPGMTIRAAADAFSLLPEHFHLAFVGRGYEGEAAWLASHPAAARVHFGLVVAPNEVVPYIRSADLGLVLYQPCSENYRYALPNGFFQVLAAGLPIVRGRLPEIESLLGERRIGICIDRLEPTALAAAIEQTAMAGGWRGAAARLAGELSWQNEAVRLRRLIEGLFPAAPGSRAVA